MIEDYYTQTMTVKRSAISKSDIGSVVDSWVTSSTFLGRIRPLKSDERIQHGKMEEIANFRLYCSANEDVLPKDRIEYDSELYDVITVRNPMTFSHHLECDLRKVT